MIESLWIYSGKNDWYTDGYHKITVEAIYQVPWRTIRRVASDWNDIPFPHQRFGRFYDRRMFYPARRDFTPKQIIDTLNRTLLP